MNTGWIKTKQAMRNLSGLFNLIENECKKNLSQAHSLMDLINDSSQDEDDESFADFVSRLSCDDPTFKAEITTITNYIYEQITQFETILTQNALSEDILCMKILELEIFEKINVTSLIPFDFSDSKGIGEFKSFDDVKNQYNEIVTYIDNICIPINIPRDEHKILGAQVKFELDLSKNFENFRYDEEARLLLQKVTDEDKSLILLIISIAYNLEKMIFTMHYCIDVARNCTVQIIELVSRLIADKLLENKEIKEIYKIIIKAGKQNLLDQKIEEAVLKIEEKKEKNKSDSIWLGKAPNYTHDEERIFFCKAFASHCIPNDFHMIEYYIWGSSNGITCYPSSGNKIKWDSEIQLFVAYLNYIYDDTSLPRGAKDKHSEVFVNKNDKPLSTKGHTNNMELKQQVKSEINGQINIIKYNHQEYNCK